MPIFPDQGGSGESKENILATSPFTSAFLSGNIETWLIDMHPESQNLIREATENLGRDWEKLTLSPLVIMAANMHVFRKDTSPSELFSLAKTLFLIGYELGHIRNVNLLLNDTVVQVGRAKVFDPEQVILSDTGMKAVQIVRTMLHTGAYMKMEKGNTDVPDIFRKFINGLDDTNKPA